MFGAWPELLRVGVALVLSGITVKWMDDALDVDYDLCRGKRTLAARLGRASLPYCLAIFSISMAVDVRVSLSVFLASYAVGMFARLTERLPSRVPAYVEMIIALLLCLAIVGWRDTLWSVSMMCMIDWLDDVMDRYRDRDSGQFNVAVRFGIVETLFAILAALCAALYAQTAWTIIGFIVWAALDILFHFTTEHVLIHDELRREEGADIF